MQAWNYGVWTYRSFYNRPNTIEKVDDILLAEGEMVFETATAGEVRGQLAFRSDKLDKGDPRLTLTGAIETGSPSNISFRGTGLSTTGARGWIYDYVGYLVPHWPGGKDQRPAIVGSVTRLVDHPGSNNSVRHAGEVFSFVAVQRDFPEPRNVIPLPASVQEMLASRHHRLHHLVWHTVRNNWFDESTIDQEKKNKIDELGWFPPRPVLSETGDPLYGNASGEDFLFMHRQMVIEVNNASVKAGHQPIVPWVTIPGPEPVVVEPDYSGATPTFTTAGNPHGYSVPSAWSTPNDAGLNQRLTALKTADYYWTRMRWWDRRFKDPSYLSTLTLGELGTLIEWSVHNDMHMRWASEPRDPRSNEVVPQGRQDWDIDPSIWDNPVYDHLGEQYSSHVNPVFWRLHGWVDARVEDWFRAHEAAHPGEVTRTTTMGTPWFKGKWVAVEMPWSGPMDMEMPMLSGSQSGQQPGGSDEDVRKMEEIIALVFPRPDAPHTMALAAPAMAQPLSFRRSRKSHF